MEILMLLLLNFLLVSCDRKYYNGSIAVEQHLWQLKKIDTFYRGDRYRPSAIWYNNFNRLSYVDNYNQFPYPYPIGTRLYNFDRK
jgi:hypothetical protein